VNRREFLSLWIPPALYLLLIFVLSGMSHPPIPLGIQGNILHYPEYAVLGFILARALQGGRPGLPKAPTLLLALLLSVFFGATDEIHQAFVPNRIPDLSDWYHDSAGAAAGVLAWWLWRWLRR
jgi:VanZ family protein